MDMLEALRTNQLERYKERFRWRPKGSSAEIRMEGMDTRHLYNTVRLLWRNMTPSHRARAFSRLRGGDGQPPRYIANGATPEKIFYMVWEIERRGDIPQGLRNGFSNLKREIFDEQFLERDLPQRGLPLPEQLSMPPGSLPTFGSSIQVVESPHVPPGSAVMVNGNQRMNVLARLGEANTIITTMTEPRRNSSRAPEVRIPRFDRLPPAERGDGVRASPNVQGESFDARYADHPHIATLRTAAFIPEIMRERLALPTYGRATDPSMLDLANWMRSVPPSHRDGAEWAVEIVRDQLRHLPRDVYLREFIQFFQAIVERAIESRDLTERGWHSPRRWDTPETRHSRRQGYPEHLQHPEQLEIASRQLPPRVFDAYFQSLLRDTRNRGIIDFWRAANGRPPASRPSPARTARASNNFSPLISFFDDVDEPRPSKASKKKKDEPKPPAQSAVNTELGIRKIIIDDGEDQNV